MKLWIAMCLAVLLAACTSIASQPALNISAADHARPVDYRITVADHVKAPFFDPYSIRDAMIRTVPTAVAEKGDTIEPRLTMSSSHNGTMETRRGWTASEAAQF